MGATGYTANGEQGNEPRGRLHESLRMLNEEIAQSARLGGPSEEAIPFVCECGESGCFRVAWISLAHYERLCGTANAGVLAAAHRSAGATTRLQPPATTARPRRREGAPA